MKRVPLQSSTHSMVHSGVKFVPRRGLPDLGTSAPTPPSALGSDWRGNWGNEFWWTRSPSSFLCVSILFHSSSVFLLMICFEIWDPRPKFSKPPTPNGGLLPPHYSVAPIPMDKGRSEHPIISKGGGDLRRVPYCIHPHGIRRSADANRWEGQVSNPTHASQLHYADGDRCSNTIWGCSKWSLPPHFLFPTSERGMGGDHALCRFSRPLFKAIRKMRWWS